eukprot:TRINITY_DN4206_c0_g1_i1.p1 TRINITY_DN4206_c0_g1~~TRINITY_DN4206_c0_g1_i1.p1  ORF type:complete len:231 (+),score=71.49 TRINITY_DN4206_c0_g1_i1:52-693(+)
MDAPAGFDYTALLESKAGYVALNALSAFCGFPPNTVTCLAAGSIHGVVEGTVLYVLSSVLGCILTVAAVRLFLKGFVMRQMAGYEAMWAGLDKAIEKQGAVYIVALLRLSPVMPLPVANAVLGLTSVPLLPYALGSLLGLIPIGAGYVYLGAVGGQAVAAAADGGGAGIFEDPVQMGAAALGLVATVILSRKISAVAQEALQAAVLSQEKKSQ